MSNAQSHVADYWLTQLQHVYPDTICAGGAPRDWYFGNTAKDIDIFVFGWGTDKSFRDKCATVGLHLPLPSVSAKEEYKTCNQVCYIYDCPPVQIILRRGLSRGLLNTFGLSLSQIEYQDGKIHPSKAFIKTVETNTVEVYDNCSDEYLARIQSKYPDFKYNRKLPAYDEEF
jgi:hypothetical protein